MFDENFKQSSIFLSTFEVIQFVNVGSEMTYQRPAMIRIFQNFQQEVQGMHVCTLTDVDNVLVFNQSWKDLEKGGQVEKLRAYIKICICSGRSEVTVFIGSDPSLEIGFDFVGQLVFFFLV